MESLEGTYGTERYCVKEKNNVKIINESNIVIITFLIAVPFLITFTKKSTQHGFIRNEIMKLSLYFNFIL